MVLILLGLTMRIKIVKQHREQHLCFVLFAAGFRDFELINKALGRRDQNCINFKKLNDSKSLIELIRIKIIK